FNVTDQVLIRFNTTSDCSNEGLITNASEFSIELRSPLGNWEGCSPIYNEYDGWYNCTWDSTGKKEGWWDIRLNSSKGYYNSNSSVYNNWFWLENVNATSENISVYVYNYALGDWEELSLDEYRGWSSYFNFTIDIYDQEGDMITCNLYLKRNSTNTWEKVGSYTITGTPGIPTEGTCWVAYQGFSCEDIGINSFKWEIKNGEPANYYNTTPINLPKLRESDTLLVLIQGNNSFVNRSSGIQPLSVNIFDTEKNSIVEGANVSFWITHDGTNYQLDIVNQTDSLGNATYYFDPDCSYSVGLQKWKAGVTDTCYIDTNTSDYYITIIGSQVPTILEPNGENYLRGTNVTLRANLKDECLNYLNESNVTFRIKNENGRVFECEEVKAEGSGNYSCTLNTSYPIVLPARWYNVTVESTKDLYLQNSTLKKNAFFIETKPVLWDAIAYPSDDGGWGETWYFRVNFTDEDLDTNTIYLYLNRSFGWINLLTYDSGINKTIVFTYSSFSGSEIGTRQFYFKAEDTRGYETNTSIRSFYLDKDDVRIEHLYGNGTVYNRSALPKLKFKVRVFDTDKNQSLGANRQGIFYITKDRTHYISTNYYYTDTSGNLTLNDITVDCSFEVGPQKWKAGTKDDNWYKDVNSSEFVFTVITVNLSANLSEPEGQSFLKGIDNIEIIGTVKDDCGYVSGANVRFVVPQTNYECIATDLGNGTYVCTIPASVHSDWSTGWYDVKMKVSKQYYNGTEILKTNAFFLATKPQFTTAPIILSQQGGSTGGWGETWTFQIYVKDEDYNQVNVSLYINLSSGWELIDSTLISATPTPQLVEFSGHSFNCEHIGTRDVKFVAVDELNYSSSSSIAQMNIEKDDVTVTFVSPYSFTLTREGDDNATLTIRVSDADRAVYITANTSYYVTHDGNNYFFAGSNVSNENGYSYLIFDPDCNYRVGIQSWKAGTENNGCYKDNIAEIPGAKITVIGQLKNKLNYPYFNQSILVGDIVNFNLSIPTDCSNDGLQNGANVSIEIFGPEVYERCEPVEDLGNGYYNCSWNTSFHKGGLYSFRINSSKQYYFDNSTYFENWVYLNNTPPITENETVTPSIGGWGETFTFRIDIDDAQFDNVTCRLFVYSNNNWQNRGNDTVYNGKGRCEVNVSDFTCLDINTTYPVEFKWEISDGTNIFNTSVIQAPSIERDPVSIEYIYGNESTANRSGTQTDLLILRIYDTIKQTPVGSGVQGIIYVTKDGINYDSGTQNLTDEDGYLKVYFDPQADYSVGLQKWKGGTYQDSCYLDANSSEFVLTILGDLYNSLLIPPTYTEYLKPVENITIRAKVTDDQPIPVSDASVNITLIHNSQEFICSPVYPMGYGEYNCTINTSTLPAGMYNLSIHSNKTYYN
ncbi:hypothetical protein DRJ17_06840, partial [Candidatus Woesearchaeota archaeon]